MMNKKDREVPGRLEAKCRTGSDIFLKTGQGRILSENEKWHMKPELHYCRRTARIIRNRLEEFKEY